VATRTYTCPQCHYTFSPVNQLTPREKAIMAYLAKGKSTRIITDNLCISMHTVSKHYDNIKGKIGVNSLREILVYAASHEEYNSKGD